MLDHDKFDKSMCDKIHPDLAKLIDAKTPGWHPPEPRLARLVRAFKKTGKIPEGLLSDLEQHHVGTCTACKGLLYAANPLAFSRSKEELPDELVKRVRKSIGKEVCSGD